MYKAIMHRTRLLVGEAGHVLGSKSELEYKGKVVELTMKLCKYFTIESPY